MRLFYCFVFVCLQNKPCALLNHLKFTCEIYTCPNMQITVAQGKVLKSHKTDYVLKHNILNMKIFLVFIRHSYKVRRIILCLPLVLH